MRRILRFTGRPGQNGTILDGASSKRWRDTEEEGRRLAAEKRGLYAEYRGGPDGYAGSHDGKANIDYLLGLMTGQEKT